MINERRAKNVVTVRPAKKAAKVNVLAAAFINALFFRNITNIPAPQVPHSYHLSADQVDLLLKYPKGLIKWRMNQVLSIAYGAGGGQQKGKKKPLFRGYESIKRSAFLWKKEALKIKAGGASFILAR